MSRVPGRPWLQAIALDPRPESKRGMEICPECERWVKVRRTDGAGLAAHPVKGSYERGITTRLPKNSQRPRCPGVGHVDTATYKVVVGGDQPVRLVVTGRNNAEIVANTYRFQDLEVAIYLEKP